MCKAAAVLEEGAAFLAAFSLDTASNAAFRGVCLEPLQAEDMQAQVHQQAGLCKQQMLTLYQILKAPVSLLEVLAAKVFRWVVNLLVVASEAQVVALHIWEAKLTQAAVEALPKNFTASTPQRAVGHGDRY